MSAFYLWENKDLILTCKLQPKASQDEIVGEHGNHLKIRITAPPIDGKANQHLVKFLAKAFGTAKGNISIENGELGRVKVIRIGEPKKIPAKLGIETKI